MTIQFGRDYIAALPISCSGPTRGYQIERGTVLTAVGRYDDVTYIFKLPEFDAETLASHISYRADDRLRYIDIAQLNNLDLVEELASLANSQDKMKKITLSNGYTLHDYYIAISDEGPLSGLGGWQDKPHRLLYDLIWDLLHADKLKNK